MTFYFTQIKTVKKNTSHFIMNRKKRNLRMTRITLQIGNSIEIFNLDSNEEFEMPRDERERKIYHIKSIIKKNDLINNESESEKECIANMNNAFRDESKTNLPHIDSIWKLSEKDLSLIFGENYSDIQKFKPTIYYFPELFESKVDQSYLINHV